MWHASELFLILLLMTVEQCAMDVAPDAARRIVRIFAVWLLAFAAGIMLLSLESIVADVVRIGILVLVAYLARWAFDSAAQFFRAPQLFEAPGPADLIVAAEQVSGLAHKECRRISRAILREHDSYIALLALMSLSSEDIAAAADLEQAWRKACEEARALAMELAGKYRSGGGKARPGTVNALFLTQALCLYEQNSIERVLASHRGPSSWRRAERVKIARQLEASGRSRKDSAQVFGIAAPWASKPGAGLGCDVAGKGTAATEGGSATQASLADILWPPLSFARAGFKGRAVAFAVSYAVLAGYGLLALSLNRDSWWIFLLVAVLLHVEAAFAVGDFNWAAAPRGEPGAVKGRRV